MTAGVRHPEWAPWWVCYEAAREGSPWVVRSYRVSTRDTRQRGYFTRAAALRVVRRLRPLWWHWMFVAALRLIPEEKWTTGFTEEEFGAAWKQIGGRRLVRLALLDIRRLAVRVGLDPDDVAYQEGDRLFPGRLLKENALPIERLLDSAERPDVLTVGQSFRPLDARRKRGFVVVSIEGDRVIGSDGRGVAVSRLLTRYRPIG